MNLPNKLTLTRILLVPVFMIFVSLTGLNGIADGTFQPTYYLIAGIVFAAASSVQSAVKKLLEKDLVTVGHKVYSISDRFFALWLATQMGPDDPLQSLV